MCLFPNIIRNPGKPTPAYHTSYKRYITIPCGKCIECLKAYATSWKIRLKDELRYGNHQNALFVTLTFDENHIEEFKDDPNKAIRRFLETYRAHQYRRYGKSKSLRHWFIAEKGSINGRVHFHGIIFDFYPRYVKGSFRNANRLLRAHWKYGSTWVGFANYATCGYIVKYSLKDATSWDRPRVCCSPGIGLGYCKDKKNINFHRQDILIGGIRYVISDNGKKCAMPKYYQSKIFTEFNNHCRSLYLSANPPPLIFNGIEYRDEYSYRIAKYNYATRLSAEGSTFDYPSYIADKMNSLFEASKSNMKFIKDFYYNQLTFNQLQSKLF